MTVNRSATHLDVSMIENVLCYEQSIPTFTAGLS